MAGWVPEKDRDSSWYIFNQKFRCSVPHIDMRSSEHIKMFGMPSCGIKEIDRETASERIDTYLSINQMVEYFKRGALVGVRKVADTKIIYERITDHLNAWKLQLQNGLNNGDAPIDDLMLLDQFANAVYAHAKYQFTAEIIDSILLRQIGGIMPLNRDSLIADMQKNRLRKENRDKPPEEQKEVEERPQRASMSDFFSTYQGRTTHKANRWE